jgi:DNA replication protein DnaC
MIPKSKLDREKSLIKGECPGCGENTCHQCSKKLSRVDRYAHANIPLEYWKHSFKDFAGDRRFKSAMELKITDIDKMYDDGESFGFVGPLGTGKTYMAACFLKIAITKGYTAGYYNMSDMIQDSIEDRGFFSKITSTDFVVIDEYDSRWVYPSEKAELLFGQTMERVLRHRFQNKMPTIICSNTPSLKDVLAGSFSRSTESLFAKFLKEYVVSGSDFRKRVV